MNEDEGNEKISRQASRLEGWGGGSTDVAGLEELGEYEEIARAMSKWSSGKPWETRHPKNQRHWLLVAEAVMSNDRPITDPILDRVRARKAELDSNSEEERSNEGD